MEGWKDRRNDRTHGWKEGRKEGQMYERTDGKDRRLDRRKYRLMEG